MEIKETPEMLFNDEKSVKTALNRAFPSKNAYFDFKTKDRTVSKAAIPIFIRLASEAGLVSAPTEAAFIRFIEENALLLSKPRIPIDLSFEMLIHEIKGDQSVNQFIKNLNRLSKTMSMPEFSAPMFSRLKKNFKPDTLKTRGLIRVLALWIGFNKPEYEWDYLSLLEISAETAPDLQTKEKEGVRIDFTFQGRGEIIDIRMMEWLKCEIPYCIKDLKLYHLTGKQLLLYTATSVSLEIPKKPGPWCEPRLFDQAIRDSLAIAHQIMIRWILSPVNDQKSRMIIGIAAGEFQKLSIPLQAIITVNLPERSTIRLNDLAKICIRITDVKVVINSIPKEIRMLDGSTLSVWSVKHFWPGYYDIAPCLLDRALFPDTPDACDAFRMDLFSSAIPDAARFSHQALQVYRRFPYNDFLGIEIAKICLSRRMFHEANEMIAVVLASDQYHVVARLLRMVVYMNLALDQSDTAFFDAFFERAVEESRLILENCIEDEEVLVEVGLLYYARASYHLSLSRKEGHPVTENDADLRFRYIKNDVETALVFLNKALTFSPTGNRSTFWIVHLRSLLQILKADRELIGSKRPILDPDNTYSHVCQTFFVVMGWLDSDFVSTTDPQVQINCLIKLFERTIHAVDAYYTSMHFRICRPNIAYAVASVLWDFSPFLTVGIAKQTLEWLEKSRMEAQELMAHGVGVYGIKAYYMQIQPAYQFVDCVSSAMEKIRSFIDTDGPKDDFHLIDHAVTNGFKLFTMHVDMEIPSGILLRTSSA